MIGASGKTGTGRGLDAAIAGVGAVYHLAPNVHPDKVAMAERVAHSAADAGVRRLVSHLIHVDLDDVAQVAALVPTANGNADRNADGHEGATYDLAGPERLSVRKLAAIAADVLGRPVDAVEIPLDDWRAGPGAALPEQARRDLVAMFSAYDRAGLVGDASTLTHLLGRGPATWRDVLIRPPADPGPLN